MGVCFSPAPCLIAVGLISVGAVVIDLKRVGRGYAAQPRCCQHFTASAAHLLRRASGRKNTIRFPGLSPETVSLLIALKRRAYVTASAATAPPPCGPSFPGPACPGPARRCGPWGTSRFLLPRRGARSAR